MKDLHQLITELDSLPDNFKRKQYLEDLVKDKNLPKHHNRRIACNILIEDNFIEKYYRKNIIELLKEKFQRRIIQVNLLIRRILKCYKDE
ncbi:hypothetical protein M2373_000967 [Chryseobacterium sp. JUb7]|nr:hypothetical protein [Chryseobacterium sp. JUb7]